MHSIGSLEPFHRFHQREDAPKLHEGTHERRLVGFPACPSCGIRGRTLGPASENPWAMVLGGITITNADDGRETAQEGPDEGGQITRNASGKKQGLLRTCEVSIL